MKVQASGTCCGCGVPDDGGCGPWFMAGWLGLVCTGLGAGCWWLAPADPIEGPICWPGPELEMTCVRWGWNPDGVMWAGIGPPPLTAVTTNKRKWFSQKNGKPRYFSLNFFFISYNIFIPFIIKSNMKSQMTVQWTVNLIPISGHLNWPWNTTHCQVKLQRGAAMGMLYIPYMLNDCCMPPCCSMWLPCMEEGTWTDVGVMKRCWDGGAAGMGITWHRHKM